MKTTEKGFKIWQAKVDKLVVAAIGMSMDDLPDWPMWDAYEDGLTPAEGWDILRDVLDDY